MNCASSQIRFQFIDTNIFTCAYVHIKHWISAFVYVCVGSFIKCDWLQCIFIIYFFLFPSLVLWFLSKQCTLFYLWFCVKWLYNNLFIKCERKKKTNIIRLCWSKHTPLEMLKFHPKVFIILFLYVIFFKLTINIKVYLFLIVTYIRWI